MRFQVTVRPVRRYSLPTSRPLSGSDAVVSVLDLFPHSPSPSSISFSFWDPFLLPNLLKSGPLQFISGIFYIISCNSDSLARKGSRKQKKKNNLNASHVHLSLFVDHLPSPPPLLMDPDASETPTSAAAVAAARAAATNGSSRNEPPLLLHGDLDLWILEARRLPNMDMFSEHLRRCFAACRPPSPASCIRSHRHQHQHRHRPKIITSDPYVTVSIASAIVARTRVIPNSQEPTWNEHFKIPLAHRSSFIDFHVKDNDVFGAQLIGNVSIPASLVASGDLVRDWFPIFGPSGKPPKPETALLVSLQFKPVERNPIYAYGIAGDPEKLGVRDTYFPLRKGGLVTLYQDAHVKEGELPEIELEKRMNFEHNKCWEDICHAILEAHHLIYIVGWSVYHKVKLVREPTRPLPPGVENFTLGELLKYKSQEGVRVCLLVWDDKTSHDKFYIKMVWHSIDYM